MPGRFGITGDRSQAVREEVKAGGFPLSQQVPNVSPEELDVLKDLARRMSRRRQGGLRQLLGVFQR